MVRVAIDSEFGFSKTPAFDFAGVFVILICLRFEDGKVITFGDGYRSFHELSVYLLNDNFLFCAHHIDAERQCLKKLDLPFPKNWYDTELGERIIGITRHGGLAFDRPIPEVGPYSLLNCRARRGMLPLRSVFEKQFWQDKCARLDYTRADLPKIAAYCAVDCADTLELASAQLAEIGQLSRSMQEIFWYDVLPFYRRVMECSERGFQFDYLTLREIQRSRESLVSAMQWELCDLGFTGQFRGPFTLFDKLTLPRHNLAVITTLENLGQHELVASLEPFRKDAELNPAWQRRKLTGVFRKADARAHTFVQRVRDYHSLIDLVQRDWFKYLQSDKRIRPACVFPGTSSYRAQQFLPHPLQLPFFARPLVCARDGHVLLQVDYKAQEVGLLASFYEDPLLLDAFNNFEKDLYWEIGLRMGECSGPYDKAKRDEVKVGILALAYGGGHPALILNLGCSYDRAHQFLNRFRRAFPTLFYNRKRFLELCQHTGVAVNPFGWERHYIPLIFNKTEIKESDLSFMNFPVQSAGANVLMRALHELPSDLQPMLLMHDALMFEVPESSLEDAATTAVRVMKGAATALFPELKVRCEPTAAYRYHKDNPASLHEFCLKRGLNLRAPIGAHYELDSEGHVLKPVHYEIDLEKRVIKRA